MNYTHTLHEVNSLIFTFLDQPLLILLNFGCQSKTPQKAKNVHRYEQYQWANTQSPFAITIRGRNLHLFGSQGKDNDGQVNG